MALNFRLRMPKARFDRGPVVTAHILPLTVILATRSGIVDDRKEAMKPFALAVMINGQVTWCDELDTGANPMKMKTRHDLEQEFRDTDNRDAESQLAYYEERIEAMTERIAELEAEVKQLREQDWVR